MNSHKVFHTVFLIIAVSFGLFGCKTTRQAETIVASSQATDSTKQISQQQSVKRDSIYVHDSIYVEYKIGRIDTLNSLRVDTLYKYKEKMAYKGEQAAEIRIDTLLQTRTDTLVVTKTKTETKIKEVEKNLSFWERLEFFLIDAFLAIFIYYIIQCIRLRYRI